MRELRDREELMRTLRSWSKDQVTEKRKNKLLLFQTFIRKATTYTLLCPYRQLDYK